MKLLIIDDFRLLTDSLGQLLTTQTDIAECFASKDVLIFKKEHPSYLPDIILLTVRSGSAMERKHWNEMNLLGKEYPESRLVVFSDQPIYMVKKYLRKGVDGYLSQSASISDLILCLRTVQKGKRFVETDVLTQLMGGARQEGQSGVTNRIASLSPVERTVADLLIQGKSGKFIAEVIHRRTTTVSDIKERIFRKLNISSITMLRQMGLQYDNEEFLPFD